MSRKPLPKIENCAICRVKASINKHTSRVYSIKNGVSTIDLYTVECGNDFCWRGPTRQLERVAINIWNKQQHRIKRAIKLEKLHSNEDD